MSFELTVTWDTSEGGVASEVVHKTSHPSLGEVLVELVKQYGSMESWAAKSGPPVAKIEVCDGEAAAG